MFPRYKLNSGVLCGRSLPGAEVLRVMLSVFKNVLGLIELSTKGVRVYSSCVYMSDLVEYSTPIFDKSLIVIEYQAI